MIVRIVCASELHGGAEHLPQRRREGGLLELIVVRDGNAAFGAIERILNVLFVHRGPPSGHATRAGNRADEDEAARATTPHRQARIHDAAPQVRPQPREPIVAARDERQPAERRITAAI
jgi:hypothetical protein